MSLRAVAPGPLATVQDLGRLGFREFGVPVSGAFDRESFLIANALLGNEPGDAALEMTGFGGVFVADDVPMLIALAGALMPSRIERTSGPDIRLVIPQVVTLRPGDTLIVGASSRGHRLYLAVKGGWQTPPILGSRSSETPLRAGDRLPAGEGESASRTVAVDLLLTHESGPLRYVDGPDHPSMDRPLSPEAKYLVSPLSDRMGLRLEGPSVAIRQDTGRLSSPVAPGAIQIAGGLPLVLGPSCGTLGGYPHVGQIITADLDRLGQVRPGDRISFERIELPEARRRDRERRERLAGLRLWLEVASGWSS